MFIQFRFLCAVLLILAFAIVIVAQTKVISDGKSFTREISVGEAHEYRIPLKAGQAVLLNMAKYSINVEQTVTDPRSVRIERTDTSAIADILIFYARRSGDYLLKVKPYDFGSKKKGNYTLKSNVYSGNSKPELIRQLLKSLYKDSEPGASVVVLDGDRRNYRTTLWDCLDRTWYPQRFQHCL